MPLSMARITKLPHYSAGQSVAALSPLEPVRTCGAPRLADGSRWDPRCTGVPKAVRGTGRVAGPVPPGRGGLTGARGRSAACDRFLCERMREVDWKAENSLVDFYWSIRYPKPASDGIRHSPRPWSSSTGTSVSPRGACQSWNGSQEQKTIPGTHGDEICMSPFGRRSLLFRSDFRKYPFDRQKLPIVIEHEVLTTEELELVETKNPTGTLRTKERWGLAPSVHIPGLEIERATRAFATQDTERTSATRRTATPRQVPPRHLHDRDVPKLRRIPDQDSHPAADHRGARLPRVLRYRRAIWT